MKALQSKQRYCLKFLIAFLSFDTSLLEFQQKCGSSVELIHDGCTQVPENCFLSLDIRLVYLYTLRGLHRLLVGCLKCALF